MRTFTFLFFLYCFFIVQTAGAVTLGISPSAQVVQNGQTVTVDVVVTGYTDVVAYQFSMNWDPAVLQFQNVSNFMSDLNAGNFNTGITGGLTVVYASSTTSPATLPDGSTIFSIQFLAIGANGASSNITFGSVPTPLKFYDSALVSLGVTTQAGLVSIAAQTGFSISGNVHRNSGQPVPGVTVDMTGDATGLDLTGVPGDYLFQNIAAGSDVTLTPSKDIEHTECVSVRDIIFIMKHILGLMPLPNPYQMIEADVNKSSSITTFDAVELRKLILGIYPQFPNNTSWRFVDAGFVIPNPSNPFQTAWPETANISDIQADAVQNFIGMKTGDATDCVNDAPAPPFVTLSASNANGMTGQQVSIDVSVQGFNDVLGLQFSMEWDPAVLQLDQVNNLNLSGLTLGNMGITSGKLAFCWNGDVALGSLSIPNGTNIFSLQFTIIGAGSGMTPVSFVQMPTKFEVVDGDCLPYGLNANNGNVQWSGGGPVSNCCIDQQAFNDKVNQGFSVIRQKCGVSVAPNDLDDCQQVTYTWGDGATSGPFAANTPAAHWYAVSGYYSICAKVEELDTLGQVCFIRDTCWEVCVTCDTCSDPTIMREWSRAGGNSFNIGGNNSNFYISSNATGDFFVTGGFMGAYQSLNSTTTDKHDCFVAKYANNGALDWEFKFGGDGEEIGTVVKTDAAGNIFVTGIYNSSTLNIQSPLTGIPSINLSNKGDEDIFLAKFDQNRNLKWAFSIGAAWGDHVEDLDVDKDGNIVITGLFRATVDFDPLFTHTTYTSSSGSNFYIAKYLSSTGELVWVKTINDDGGAFPLGVSTEPGSGDVYAAGHFSASVDFNGDALPEMTHNGVGPNAIAPFIVKYSAAGVYQWSIAIQDAPKTSTGVAWDIEADANSVYVAGDYGNAPGIDFDPVGGDPAFELNGSASFVARYDHNGVAQCVQNPPDNVGAYELSIGPDNLIYLTGNRYNQRMFVGIFDQNCTLIKSIEPHGTDASCALSWSVAPDPFGDFAIIGRFTGPDFDADPMAGNGPEHNSDGTCVGPNNGITDVFADIFIGKYSCVCPDTTSFCSVCDSISIAATRDTFDKDKCCYNLQISNQSPGYFSSIYLTVLEGGELNIPVGVYAGWSVQGYSSTHVYLAPDAGVIGTGESNVAQICLKNLTADVQVIEIEYYDLQYNVVCRDTLRLQCEACVQTIVDSVYCGAGNVYKMDFCVKAGENLDWTLGSISIVPPPGITFTPDMFSLPALAPGQTYCHLTTTVTGGAPGQEICFASVVHHEDIVAGEPDLSCCADTVPVCFTLPACDPCDSTVTYATYEQVTTSTDSCCWKITLHNPPNYYTGVSTEIITPGVVFDAVFNFPPVTGWQTSLNTSTYIAWDPFGIQGSYVQDGWMLPVVCFDGNVPGPWELAITWYTEDSTECYDTLQFDCPVTETGGNEDCATLDSVSMVCNPDGTFSFTFTVTNHTFAPAFTSDHIHVTPAGPFTVNPADFYLILPPAATSPPLTTTITGSPTGGVFNFIVSLHEINDDSLHLNCCNTDTLPFNVCPPAVPIDNKAFHLYQNQPNPWSEQTSVRFYSGVATTATLTVYDAVGRILYSVTGEFPQGDNVFLLDKKISNADGMLYYRVETPAASATMKMIREK